MYLYNYSNGWPDVFVLTKTIFWLDGIRFFFISDNLVPVYPKMYYGSSDLYLIKGALWFMKSCVGDRNKERAQKEKITWGNGEYLTE